MNDCREAKEKARLRPKKKKLIYSGPRSSMDESDVQCRMTNLQCETFKHDYLNKFPG